MSLWPKFSKEHPCPKCGHSDWLCRGGTYQLICMRVQSGKPSKDGGWYHDYPDKATAEKVSLMPKRRALPTRMDFESVMQRLLSKTQDLSPLANQLGVSIESLQALQVAWWPEQMAWAFPMRDGENKIVGICRRYLDGSKKFIGNIGLFIPQIPIIKETEIVEGASDAASILTCGMYAIGRASCMTGAEMLKTFFNRNNIHRVVLFSDNDELKAHGKRPGFEGAKRLKKDLGIPSVLIMPPSPLKDCRQMLQRFGPETTRKMISDMIGNKVWSRV